MPELVKELFYRQYLGTTSIIPLALGYIKFLLRVGFRWPLEEWAVKVSTKILSTNDL